MVMEKFTLLKMSCGEYTMKKSASLRIYPTKIFVAYYLWEWKQYSKKDLWEVIKTPVVMLNSKKKKS